jgi:hypothetical protein
MAESIVGEYITFRRQLAAFSYSNDPLRGGLLKETHT